MSASEKLVAAGAPDLPQVDYRASIRLGAWMLAVGFGGFLAWAALAPLDEGVPAPGTVSVESKRKTIEHLNGGIVEKILVREGERVSAGQQLLVLNETQAKAAFTAARSQWRIALAMEARLQAERAGLKSVAFPKELIAAQSDPEVATAMRDQTQVFRARRAALEGELSIMRESVLGLETQIKSLEQLLKDRERQIALFDEQLGSYRKLNRDGFISRNQLLETERQLTEVQTKQSEDLSNIAGVKARLAEFRTRAAQREVEYRKEVETQLTEVQKDLANSSEKYVSQQDVHRRLVITSPVAGRVVDLAAHTIGGVVKPGERIMDIVPEGDELIVEAQVPPQYIDRVHAELPADVHFDAYMSRPDRPVLKGKVSVVSADSLTDSRTGTAYYAMRVSVAGDELKKLGDMRMQPGMQATVMVKTGERTLMVYLVRPLLRRFTSAMSER